MKKFFLLIFIVLLVFSCSQQEIKTTEQNVADYSFNQIDTFLIDSSNDKLLKIETLIKSTENADKKVTEIKVMKKENCSLKNELKETKEELKLVKEQVKLLDSSLKEKEKKGFIKRVVDNIKGEKDSI
jgi:basic membrane lipoprotein Med (substrate-binding protein (PBP1-ABC) superfamily)